jgi:hypothetical protein
MNQLRVIDRKIINSNIKYYDFSEKNEIKKYTYTDLISLIDKIKNYLLVNYKIEKGQTVVIGYKCTCDYKIACFFACLELGLTITIIDYKPGGSPGEIIKYTSLTDSNKSRNFYLDTRTKLLSPIHYFIDSGPRPLSLDPLDMSSPAFFQLYCPTTIYHEDLLNHQIVENVYSNIEVDEELIAIKCTTSGTTGTPKVIELNHKFLYDICKRNSKTYYGNIVNEQSLNHGSGPTTYFIPTLMADNVQNIFNLNFSLIGKFTPKMYAIRNKNIFDHMLFAHSHEIDWFLNTIDESASNLTIYTLSTIKKDWVEFVKENKIKNIVSLFGTSETAGPIFINQASDENFIQNKFNLIDDYYEVSLNDKKLLEVKIPVYDEIVCTNDEFTIDGKDFYHNGRRDLLRINGLGVVIGKYDEILKSLDHIFEGKFVYDTVENEIYLALWKDVENINSIIKAINDKMISISSGTHFVSKCDVLEYTKFLSGIKIDDQLLRDHFKHNVKKIYDILSNYS